MRRILEKVGLAMLIAAVAAVILTLGFLMRQWEMEFWLRRPAK